MAEVLGLFGGDAEVFRRQDGGGNVVETVKGAAAKRFRPIDRQQLVMRTVDVEKLVEEDHPVRAIWAMVCQLDWSRFEQDVKVVEGGKGRSHLDPRLLAALWIYAYSEGVNAARELSRMCRYEPGCQWLTGMQEVSYHTLSDFRVQDKAAQDELFKQVLGRLSAAGLTELKRVGHDGTKIRAQASAGSFHGEDTLRRHLRLAEEQIQAMGDADSPEASPQQRQAKSRLAAKKQRLEQALAELNKYQQEQHGKKNDRRVSETEPEARVMKQPEGGFAPSYNVQISTDALNKVIVAVETTQAVADCHQLVPAMQAIENNMGRKPEQMLSDGAYINNGNIEQAAEQGIDLIGPVPDSNREAALKKRGVAPEFYPDKFGYDAATNQFTCPAGKALRFKRTSQRTGARHHQYLASAEDCQQCRFRQQCTPKKPARMVIRIEDSAVVSAFKEKMQTEEAKQIYRRRAEVAETPNAWIKEKFGLRRFRLRGLVKAGMEAVWACLTYNIRQWIRLSYNPQVVALRSDGGGVSL